MILVNAITEKTKNLNLHQLKKFILDFDNGSESLSEILKHFEKGNTIYWCTNPYTAEMSGVKDIIFSVDKEDVINTYYRKAEEI